MACFAIPRLTSQYNLQLLESASIENKELSDNVTDHSSLASEMEGSSSLSLVNPKLLRSRSREEDDSDKEFLEGPKKKVNYEFDSSPRSIGHVTTSSEGAEKSLGLFNPDCVYQGCMIEDVDFELGLDLDEMRNFCIISELHDLRCILDSEQDLLLKKHMMTEFQAKVLHAASEFLLTRSFDRIPEVLSMVESVVSLDHLRFMSNFVIQALIFGTQENALACLRFIPDSLDGGKSFKSDLILFFHKIACMQGDSSLIDSLSSSLSLEYKQLYREQKELFDVVFKKVDLVQLLPKVFAEFEALSDQTISESQQKYYSLFALRMGCDKNFEAAANILSRLMVNEESVEIVRKISLISLLEADFASFECFVEGLSEQFSVQDLLVYLIPRKDIPFKVRVSLFSKLEQSKLKGEVFEEVSALLCAEAYRLGHVRLAEQLFQGVEGEKFMPLINFEKDLCEFKIHCMFRRNFSSAVPMQVLAEVESRYKNSLEMLCFGDLNAMNILLHDLPECFHEVCFEDILALFIDQKKFDLAFDFIERFCGASPRLEFMLANLAISAATCKSVEHFDRVYFDPRISKSVALLKAKIRLVCHIGRFSEALELLSSLQPVEESEFILEVLESLLKNRQVDKVAAFLKRFVPLYVSLQVDEDAKAVFFRNAFKILITNDCSEDCLSLFSYVQCEKERDAMFDAFILEQCSLR